MKKTILSILCMILFSAEANAGTELITNGTFDDGLNGWGISGDVRLGTPNPISNAQGMDGDYALLGLLTTSGTSQIMQSFDATGYSFLTVSFDWALDYFDNSASASDIFLSLVTNGGAGSSLLIPLLDLETTGTSFLDPDWGAVHGTYTKTFSLSGFSGESNLIFSLVEGSDSYLWTGTAFIAGIDNISIKGTTAVPMPETLLLFGFGIVGLASVARYKSYQK